MLDAQNNEEEQESCPICQARLVLSQQDGQPIKNCDQCEYTTAS